MPRVSKLLCHWSDFTGNFDSLPLRFFSPCKRTVGSYRNDKKLIKNGASAAYVSHIIAIGFLWLIYQCSVYEQNIEFQRVSRLRIHNNVLMHLIRRRAASRRHYRNRRALINTYDIFTQQFIFHRRIR